MARHHLLRDVQTKVDETVGRWFIELSNRPLSNRLGRLRFSSDSREYRTERVASLV